MRTQVFNRPSSPGPSRTEWTIRLKDVASILRQIRELQTEFADASGLLDDALDDLALVLEELLTNLYQHSTAGKAAIEAKLTLIRDGDSVWCDWLDSGSNFDPFAANLQELDAEGGVGLPLVRHFVTAGTYERRGDYNHLSFCVALAPTS